MEQEFPPDLHCVSEQIPFEQIPVQHCASSEQVRFRSRQPWSYGWQVPSMQPSRREVQSSHEAPPRPQEEGALARQTPSAPQQPSAHVRSLQP